MKPVASMSGSTDAPMPWLRVGMFVAELARRSPRVSAFACARVTPVLSRPVTSNVALAALAAQRIENERKEHVGVPEHSRAGLGRKHADDRVRHTVEQDAAVRWRWRPTRTDAARIQT